MDARVSETGELANNPPSLVDVAHWPALDPARDHQELSAVRGMLFRTRTAAAKATPSLDLSSYRVDRE